MKKKILYLITKSNWGGAQRYVYDLATHLDQQYEISVALGGNGPLKTKLEERGVRTIQIPDLQRDISMTKELLAFGKILTILKTENPEILHVNSSKAGGLGALAGRMAGIKKIVFTVHGWPHEEPRNLVAQMLMYFFSWLTAVLSRAVIVVSKHDLETAQRMPGVSEKTVLIYNGIDAEMHFGTGEVIRAVFPKGVRITGTIGELTRNKNQIALIERALKEPDLYVAIVGEGEDRPMLEEKIKENHLEARMKLFGFLPAIEVLKGFDEFALPSLKEGLPYVLLEAKAAGLPIEANRVGGVGEILDEGHDFSLARMLKETTALYGA
jgi:glycosyltransferase involved in cell wall biosynthesis